MSLVLNTLRAVRRAGLSLVMFVIGLALIGGALTVILPGALVPDTFRPLDHYVGTEGSVVGAVFGLGLCWAAVNPAGNRLWVHLGMLYALLLIVRELTNPSNGKSVSLAPIIFGGASLLLLLALYPGFGAKKAVAPPPVDAPPASAPPPQPAPAPTAPEREGEST
jgi:hypothetical protein